MKCEYFLTKNTWNLANDIKMYKTISNVVEKSIVGSYDVLENKRYFQPSRNMGIGKRKHSFLKLYTQYLSKLLLEIYAVD